MTSLLHALSNRPWVVLSSQSMYLQARPAPVGDSHQHQHDINHCMKNGAIMRTNTIRSILTAGLLTLASGLVSAAGPAATIDQLAWMTGNYAGNLGPNTLEENWIVPEAGSIAAVVRMTGPGGTSMFEMITIEEVEGSLVLHLQQFDPGFQPRTPAAIKMELAMITDKHVHFNNVGDSGMRSLGYSLNGDTFTIHIEQPNGQTMNIELQKRSLWD